MNEEMVTSTAEGAVVRLYVGNQKSDSVRAFTYGELVKLAMPTIEAYHSDLFRDAQWLQENLHAQAHESVYEFYFGVRPYGTFIGVQVPYVAGLVTISWHVEVTAKWVTIYPLGVIARNPIQFGGQVQA